MSSHVLAILYLVSAIAEAALAIAKAILTPRNYKHAILIRVFYCILFLSGAISAWLDRPLGLPEFARHALNNYLTAPVLTFLLFASVGIVIGVPNPISVLEGARHVGTFVWLWFLISLENRHFASLVLAPDHIAVVLLIASSAFFVWKGLVHAAENDRRQRQGDSVLEARPYEKERIFVWPDLVYIEFIAMLVAVGILLLWSLLIPAPLEAPADPTWTPNPAKAPWYFVGLQELLVYFDAWLAGVMIPVFIMLGLCLIPYVDTRPTLSGYYGLSGRRFATGVFLTGYTLWVVLILIGTFYRGPDWQFYGLYESRAARKTTITETQPLSQILARSRSDQKAFSLEGNLGRALLREVPGISLLLLLFVGVPAGIKIVGLSRFLPQWGSAQYWIMMSLLIMMALIPIKMYANWLFGINYFVWLPEVGINI